MYNELDYIETIIIDKLTGNISPEDDVMLVQLIEQDSAVREKWDEMQLQFAILNAGNAAQKNDQQQAWQKIQAALIQEENELIVTKEYKYRGRKRWAVALVAVLLITIGTVVYYKNSFRENKSSGQFAVLKMANGQTIEIPLSQQNIRIENGQSPILLLGNGDVLVDAGKGNIKEDELNTLSVPVGGDYHLQLADGTEVWLNSATEFQFPLSFSGHTRKIKLKGEGFFKVAHDAQKPFIVNTQNVDVEVLGTQFNVNSYDAQPSITSLVEGKVSLHSKSGKEVALVPGKEGIIGAEQKFRISDFNETTTLAWMKGVYMFNNEELQSVKPILERWYGLKVEIVSEAIAKKRFSGAIEKNKRIESFLNNITRSSGIKFQVQNNKVSFY